MDMFWSNRFLSNSLNFLILLLVVTVVLHLVLVWPRNRPLKFWKCMDYIWLSLATISVLATATDVRIKIAENWVVQDKARAEIYLELIKDVFYIPPESHYYGIKFNKTENSPSDLEELQKQYAIAFEWYKEAWRIAQDINISDLPDISLKDFPEVHFNDVSLNETVDWLEKRIDNYSVEKQKYLKTAGLATIRDWEEALAYFAPFLLCSAIALRLAKVTGELRYYQITK